MNEKLDVKEIIKVGAILFVITALAAAVLGFVNSKTAPLIAENNVIKEQTALKNVMPDAVSFEEVEITPALTALADETSGEISKAFIALDSNSEKIGACVITVTTGYDVGIQTATGIDNDLVITGVDIISMNETPGLGANASKPEFREQYVGKADNLSVVKSSPNEYTVQAIAGVTKTSNGVTNGVNIARKAAEIILEGGNG